MKKLLELSIVVWSLFFLIYFLLYMFYFDSMCNWFKKEINWDYTEIIWQIWTCKSSLVCWINDIVTNKQNIIIDWNCDKKINNSLEMDFYFNYFSEKYYYFINKF